MRHSRVLFSLPIITLLLALFCPSAYSADRTLTVVAAYGSKEEIFGEFTKKTGISVQFIDMSSGEVLARAEAEGGKPMADLWFGGGADSFIKAGQKGLLEAYLSPEAATVPAHYKDPAGYWTGVSLVMAGFLVNTEVLAEKKLPVPESWADLIKPEYKGEVLVADPAISGTTYAMAACLLQKMGEEEGWKYLEALSKNVPFFAKRGGEPPKKVAAGEMAVGIAPLSGEFINMKKKFPIDTVFPKDGIPWVPAGMAIFKNAKNPAEAKAFVDWALSIDGQKIIQAKDPRVMVRPEIANPKEMGSFALSDLITVDIIKVGTQRQQILDTWAKRVAVKP